MDSPQARDKKLNSLVLIGASCGVVPGLIGGIAAASAVGLVKGILFGTLGGLIGGSASALLIVIKAGIDKEMPLWWFVVSGLIGGLIGGLGLIAIMGGVDAFQQWLFWLREKLWFS